MNLHPYLSRPVDLEMYENKISDLKFIFCNSKAFLWALLMFI